MSLRTVLELYRTAPLAVRAYVQIRKEIFDFERLLEWLPLHPKLIYDMGCGWGLFSFLLAERFAGAKIEAYDADLKRIEWLKRLNPYSHLTFVQKNILSFHDYRADAIVFNDFFHHVSYETQEKILQSIRSSMPERGAVIVKEMDKGRFSIRQFFNYLIDVFQTREFSFYYRTRSSFEELFRSSGFDISRQGCFNRSLVPLNHAVFSLSKSPNRR